MKTVRMMNNDDQYVQISSTCVSFLSERHVYEKGLFRTQASLTEVRALRTQMMNGTLPRAQIDPHLIVGVLQTSLKDMKHCLLEEIYGDILSLELNSEKMTSLVVKLPSIKLDLVSFSTMIYHVG